MRWRKFNGEPIEIPIHEAVENAIKRETAKGYRPQSMHRHRFTGKRERKLNLQL
jgi:hypothetical protein